MHRLEANRSPFPCNAAEFGCVSMRGLDADRRWGHRSRISKIKAFDLRMIRLRGQSSISIRNMSNPYAGQAGLGHVEAAKMAIEDAGG
jgi:hypothetical protein